MQIRFDLPLPPSTNGAYTNRKGGRGKGRYPSKAHKEWKIEAGWLLNTQKSERIIGPYRFTILVPQDMRGDVSNRVKLAEDLMVEFGITPDDRYAVSSHAERSMEVAPKRCIIILEAV